MFFVFFAFSCGGGGDSGSNNPIPTAAIQASASSIQPGQSVTISWQTSGGAVALNPPIMSNPPASGSATCSPAATTTYSVTVTAPDGQWDGDSVTVTVNPVVPPPTAAISANPTSIQQGQVSLISWVTSGGTVSIIPDIGNNLPAVGSQIVTPATTTTYTLTVTAPDNQQATDNVTVNVTTVPKWQNPAGWTIWGVATDNNVVVRMGHKLTGSVYTAVAACFNSGGDPLWTAEGGNDFYFRSTVANGSIYLGRHTNITGNHWIDRRKLGDGALVGSSLYMDTALRLDLTNDSTGIYASLAWETYSEVYKVDFNLSSKTFLFSVPYTITDIRVSGGKINLAATIGDSAAVMVYTTAGVPAWSTPQTYTPAGTYSVGRGVGSLGNSVYLTGNSLDLQYGLLYPAFLREYDTTNGAFIRQIDLAPYGSGSEIAFGPVGELYIAMWQWSTLGPQAVSPSGQLGWTGTEEAESVVYFQGKVIGPQNVNDAVTGQLLYWQGM